MDYLFYSIYSYVPKNWLHICQDKWFIVQAKGKYVNFTKLIHTDVLAVFSTCTNKQRQIHYKVAKNLRCKKK